MHARNRTWPLGSDPAERCRQRTMPVEGGDGSTLSLDFTTGVLDPRLTFTRSSDATFINSSGQVQYADANWVRNSTMLVSTGWTAATVNGGTATINGDGSVTFASTAGRITWLQTLGLASGLPITFSIEVTALTAGDIRVSDLFAAGFGFGSQIYHHTSPSGVTQNNISSSAGLGTFGVGLYTVTATTTGTTNNIIFGTDCNGINRTGSVTIRNPQLQYGTVVPRRVYVPNSSTSSAKWDSARFDYAPDTLAPRGLLIEGAASNLVTQSNGSTGVWTTGGHRTPTNNTTDLVSPDGTNNATKLVCGTAGNYASFATSISGLTGGATYTISYWIRGPVGHSPRLYAQNGTIGDVTATATTGTYNNTGWTRLTQTYTLPAATTQCLVYFLSTNIVTTGDTFYVYGFQMETGSGASSHIPTGSSTGSRAADSCVMTGTNFSSWFAGATEGVLYAEVEQPRKINSPANDHGVVSTLYTSGTWLGIQVTATNQFPSSVIWPTGGFVFAGGIATRVPLVSKQAVRWFNGASITNFGNGTQGSTAVGTGSVTLGLLTIGANVSSGTTANLDWLNGCIRRVKFWPTALPNATIQALTT